MVKKASGKRIKLNDVIAKDVAPKKYDDFLDAESETFGADSNKGSEEDDETISVVESSTTATRKRKHRTIAPPMSKGEKMMSQEELKRLKDMEFSFHSNMFRLQTEELLKEVKPTQKLRSKLDAFVRSVQDAICSIPETDSYQLCDQRWLNALDIKYPISDQPSYSGTRASFNFLKPSKVEIVGSYRHNVAIRPEITVDLTLEMPKEMFGNRDYLNHMYHTKRALYLCVIASHLKNLSSVKSLNFTYLHCDPLKPTLIIVPEGTLSKHCRVQLLPRPPDAFAKPDRFHPSVSNIRSSWYFGRKSDEDSSDPTPIYNHGLLIDLLLRDDVSDQDENEVYRDGSSVNDGLILANCWLRQRQLHCGFGAVTNFFFRSLVPYLLKKRVINIHMSSYQIFRCLIFAIAQSTWDVCGSQLSDSVDQNVVSDFKKYYPVILLNRTGKCNLFGYSNKTVYHRLQHEAKRSLEILDSSSSDAFTALFLTPVPFGEKFDTFLRIDNIRSFSESSKNRKFNNRFMDFHGTKEEVIAHSLLPILERGFTDRVAFMETYRERPTTWPVDVSPPSAASERLVIGLLFNSENYQRVIDRGPLADSKDAAEFRALWGEKSEMRKFADGSICEAVVWEPSNAMQRRHVVDCIAKWLLYRHFEIQPIHVHFSHGAIDTVLRPASLTSDDTYGTGEDEFRTLTQGYEKLAQQLRSIDGLPLGISRITAISPSLRHTDVFPPVKCSRTTAGVSTEVRDNCLVPKANGASAPPWRPSHEVHILLETSGKWPEDLEAIRRLKAAFYLKMGQLLKEQFNVRTLPFEDQLLIISDAYIFRLIIVYGRELVLLKQTKNENGSIVTKDNAESHELEMRTEFAAVHASSILGLIHNNPSFPVACRYARRWVTCQMLSDYVSQEVVELLVAALYLDCGPFTVPSSPFVAFLRFLRLLATFDWLIAPLFVNFNSTLTDEQRSEIQARFRSLRPTLPPMCIVTPSDENGCRWTRAQPTALIVERLCRLAKASLDVLNSNFYCPTPALLKTLFQPTPDVYDVLILLRDKFVPKRFQALDSKFEKPKFDKNQYRNRHVFPVVDFDPVERYLRSLRETYEIFAWFFHDSCGGNVIGVVWKPQAMQPADISVSHLKGRIIRKNDEQVPSLLPNVDAFIEDFQLLGRGLVQTVKVQRPLAV